MIFWDEVLVPGLGAALTGGTLAVLALSATARAGLGNRLGLKWAEAAVVLALFTVALLLQAYVHLHLDPMTDAARTAHDAERIVAVVLLPSTVLVVITGIRRVRGRRRE